MGSGTAVDTAQVAAPETAAGTDPVDRWRRAAASTAPADRAAAEAGIRLAYRRSGLSEPEDIVWADSPLAAIRLLAGAEGPERRGRSVREAVRTAPWAAERARLHAELGPVGWAARWQSTGGRLWEGAQSLTARISTVTIDAFTAQGTARPDRDRSTGARMLLLDALHGQQDAAWLSAFDTSPGSPLAGVAAVAEAAGWWWPYERVAVVCERPTELHRDEAGRLDRADGPALAFRDGLAAYSWRGMPVPGEFLDELSALTPDRIRTEENAELRRVMLEHYGYDRYLAESGAVPEHRDESGVLWRVAMDGDEDTVMVEVLNSTPEPDGTTRTYWLRVPPGTRTAKEGVAWTFGLTPEEYDPLRQT